ncbi:MAG: Unknown protein [uncultured Sulfurovum sp.]|uniref:GT-D fold-like domain-containing protein n=1 Tax=uncultured Sulfurovum sp. TaxID=269237 RepID=A0A6S6U174_9BACT|nr:MAG: Unknown protein [uncultured Sulfurovum sp.]
MDKDIKINSVKSEIDYLAQEFRDNPNYFDTKFVCEAYQSCGLDVYPNPKSLELISSITKALKDKTAFSVIRIGDGEMNLLALDAYPKTPLINKASAKEIVAMMEDCFILTPLYETILRDLLFSSILQADIIGVLGVYRINPNHNIEDKIKRLLVSKSQRGTSGHIRGVEFMLNMGKAKQLENKIITSAFLYLSILDNLETIFTETSKVFLITKNKKVFLKLQKRYTNIKFIYLQIGNSNKEDLSETPHFLFELYNQLPQDMSDSLTLIGAGVWAEIYAMWIKQKGGVAVDIGSGFDLLNGESTRIFHHRLKEDTLKYKL